MKSRKLFAFILALVCAVCLAAFAACGDGSGNENESKISALFITEEPTKKDYVEGETFDPAGMVVTVKYTDNETKTVTDYTISPNGALTTSVNQITVSYTEDNVTRSAKVDITVRADSNLVELEVLARPVKVDYMVGDMLDLKDLTLLAKYSDGSSREIKSGFVCEQLNAPLTVEDQKITVSYTERGVTKTAKFNINVLEPYVLGSIEVTTQPTNTAYAEGDVFSPAGMVVTAHYTNGQSKVISNYTYSQEGFSKNDTKITLSYTEDGITKTVDVAITITKYLESISAGGTCPAFKVGEVFTTDWIKVTGNYSDGSTVDFDNFTVNKTGRLTIEDNGAQVEVTVGTMKSSVTLTVTDFTGTPYEMGIEGADQTQVDGSSSAEAKAFIEAHNYKGGLNNNVDGVAFHFNSSAAQKVRVEVIMAANESGDMLLKDIFDVSLNGVRLSDELDGVNVLNPDKIAYFYFQKITFIVTVAENDNTLRFVSHGSNGTNLAGVILTSEDESQTVGDMTLSIYRYEAENARLVGLPNDNHINGQTAFVAANKPNNSGGKTVENMTREGNQIIFTVNSDKATKAKLFVCLASTFNPSGNTETLLKDAWKISINGVESVNYADVKILPSDWAKVPAGAGIDPTPWYNDYVVIEFEIDLQADENVILFEAKAANNMDYIEFATDAVLTWTNIDNPIR